MKLRFFELAGLAVLLCLPGASQASSEGKSGGKISISLSTGGDRDSARDIVSVARSVVLAEGDRAKDVVVIGGSAQIHGSVEGDVVVVAGRSLVDGSVEGDAVAIGSLVLSSRAVVGGDAVAVGGSLSIAPGARVKGERTEVGIGLLRSVPLLGDSAAAEALRRWITEGLLWMRPFPHQVWWAWAAAAILLAFNVLLALVFPSGVTRCAAVLEERPLSALLTGVLAGLLAGPLSVFLTFTVVGILAIPFVILLLLCAVVFGKVVAAGWTGQGAGRRLGLPWAENLPAAVAVGTGLIFAVYLIPVLGLAAWVLTGAFGTGAVLLAAFDALRKETGAGSSAPAAALSAASLPTEAASPASSVGSLPQGRQVLGGAGSPPIAGGGLPRAGFWPRCGAVCIDVFVVGFVGAVTPLPAFSLPLWLAYQVGFWTWKSTTIGGIVFDLKGLRLDGRPMDFGVALVRHLASYLSAMALFLGFLWAGWDPEGRTWHDKLAGTVVVRVPKGELLLQ
ncbi:MAG: RDD family protein [Elusimicrobia bacterium]|nr:RDD family protein [Elusimicrobiota bacterium]